MGNLEPDRKFLGKETPKDKLKWLSAIVVGGAFVLLLLNGVYNLFINVGVYIKNLF